MHTFEDDDDKASHPFFASIFVALGKGVIFLLVNPFDCETSKIKLIPSCSCLKGDEVM